MTGTHARPGRPADVDAAVEVWRAARAAEGRRPPAAEVARIRSLLGDPDAVLVVAEGEDDLAGVAAGRLAVESGTVRLDLLVVALDARRRGVGAALLEALADAAFVRGARRLVAQEPDAAAAAFLQACGLGSDGPQRLVAALDPPVRDLPVRDDGLRLGQLLKLAGLVDTGSQAKALLDADGVEVNGELERRRGRQLADGDVVVAQDQAVRVVLRRTDD